MDFAILKSFNRKEKALLGVILFSLAYTACSLLYAGYKLVA